MRSIVVGLASAAAFVCLGADTAAACQPLVCQAGSLTPSGGTIPRNAAGIRWHLGTTAMEAKHEPRITVTRDGTNVAFGLVELDGDTMRVELTGGFIEGATYHVTADEACDRSSPRRMESTFTVGPEAPMPTELGRLRPLAGRIGPLEIGTDAGSCEVRERAVVADLEVFLAPSAVPWKQLIDYEAQVDGQPWQYHPTIGMAAPLGASFVGRGMARVYARCEDPSDAFQGAGVGRHDVSMSGVVFGSGTTLSTPTASLSLSCTQGTKLEQGSAGSRSVEPANVDSSDARPESAAEPAAPTVADDARPTAAGRQSNPGAHASACRIDAAGSPLFVLLCIAGFLRRRP